MSFSKKSHKKLISIQNSLSTIENNRISTSFDLDATLSTYFNSWGTLLILGEHIVYLDSKSFSLKLSQAALVLYFLYFFQLKTLSVVRCLFDLISSVQKNKLKISHGKYTQLQSVLHAIYKNKLKMDCKPKCEIKHSGKSLWPWIRQIFLKYDTKNTIHEEKLINGTLPKWKSILKKSLLP